MRIIIAGSRWVTDYALVVAAMEAATAEWKLPVTEIVSGAAPGVDSLGERWAREHGVPVKRFPADWSRYGRRAGPRRNGQMAEYGEALCAIWDGESRGTGDMIARARARKLLVYVHRAGLIDGRQRRGEPLPGASRDGRTAGTSRPRPEPGQPTPGAPRDPRGS